MRPGERVSAEDATIQGADVSVAASKAGEGEDVMADGLLLLESGGMLLPLLQVPACLRALCGRL